jgi:hypothetical protein
MDNMALNLRPFVADFFVEKRRTDKLYGRRGTDEAFKALTMIGIMFSFFMAMQGPFGKFKDKVKATTIGGYLNYILESALIDFLLIPGLFFLFVFLSKKVSRNREVKLKEVFVNFSYTLVPVGLAVWGAFCLGIIMPTGSYLLHILSDPFAWSWNLIGTARFPWKPSLTQLMPYFQIFFVTIGLVFSLDLGYKFSQHTFRNSKDAKRGWIPILVFLLIIHAFFFWLLVG